MLALRVGVARRRGRSIAVGEDPSGCASRAGASRVEAEVVDLVEPADVHLVEVPVRLEPRDRLIVGPQVEVRPAALRAGCPPNTAGSAGTRDGRAQLPAAQERLVGSFALPP